MGTPGDRHGGAPACAAKIVRQRIQAAGVSVYENPAVTTSGMFYAPEELEAILRQTLVGAKDLHGLPVRTRSKVAKGLVCEALGYMVPATFTRVQPRLPHPNLDVYVQKTSNLQIWNQEVDSARRYVIITLNATDTVSDVFVIAGADLAQFDTTGTLTRKFQANRIDEHAGSRLVSTHDTEEFARLLLPLDSVSWNSSSVSLPQRGQVLPISDVYEALLPLVGSMFSDPGITQERNRGTVVHREACIALGLGDFADHGQFPDVLSQALEVKLQLARTIDLGLELPNSPAPIASLNGQLAACDVRYAIFYADRLGGEFKITSLVVTTGRDFFTEFRQFGGKVSNSKLQLRLPAAWF